MKKYEFKAKTSYHKRCDNTEAVQSEVEKLNAIHSTPGKDLERVGILSEMLPHFSLKKNYNQANERYANARKAEKESKATYESAVKTLQRNKECLEREMERCFEASFYH